jgi:hypothetical protein
VGMRRSPVDSRNPSVRVIFRRNCSGQERAPRTLVDPPKVADCERLGAEHGRHGCVFEFRSCPFQCVAEDGGMVKGERVFAAGTDAREAYWLPVEAVPIRGRQTCGIAENTTQGSS